MTPELRALLERIEAAGGPVVSHEGRWAALLPNRDGVAPYVLTEYDSGESEARLLHALKLDARARGAKVSTGEDLADRTHQVAFLNTGRAVTLANHDDEATAHCEAWLAAFGQEAGQ